MQIEFLSIMGTERKMTTIYEKERFSTLNNEIHFHLNGYVNKRNSRIQQTDFQMTHRCG